MRHKAEAEARRARIMEDQVRSCHMFNLHFSLCLAVHSTQPVIHVCHVNGQVAARQATITSLEEALRSRSTDTPSRLVRWQGQGRLA